MLKKCPFQRLSPNYFDTNTQNFLTTFWQAFKHISLNFKGTLYFPKALLCNIYFLQSQGQLTRDDDFMKLGGKYFRYK